MNIGLINTYSYDNIGDAAIYAALSNMLAEHSLFSTLPHTTRTHNAINFAKDLNQCTQFISVGGDIFNNTRPHFITRQFLSNLQQLKKAPKSTFSFGQSIPASCHGLALKLLTHQLKKLASVTVRDQQSYQLLTQQDVNCTLSYDSAFILDCSQQAQKTAAELLNQLHANRSALISLREFNALYPVDNAHFARNMVILCRQLRLRDYQPVLLIQSNVSALDSDLVLAKEIQQHCPQVKILDVRAHSTATLPAWELLQALLKVTHLIVAVRYHTAVLALAAGRVPFNLFYSNKGADLSLRLGIPGCHVEHFRLAELSAYIEHTGSQKFSAQSIKATVKRDFYANLKQAESYGGPYEYAQFS